MIALFALAAVGSSAATAVAGLLVRRVGVDRGVTSALGRMAVPTAVLALPFALFGRPSLGQAQVVALYGAAALLLAVLSLGVVQLGRVTSAATVATATALSPALVAALSAAVLGISVSPGAWAATLLVVGGVVLAVRGAVLRSPWLWALIGFVAAGYAAQILLAAALLRWGESPLSVMGVRAVIAGLILTAAVRHRPTLVDWRRPTLGPAAASTAGYLLSLIALLGASPLLVQSVLSTAPLIVVALEMRDNRRRPPTQVVVGAAAVLVGSLLSFVLR